MSRIKTSPHWRTSVEWPRVETSPPAGLVTQGKGRSLQNPVIMQICWASSDGLAMGTGCMTTTRNWVSGTTLCDVTGQPAEHWIPHTVGALPGFGAIHFCSHFSHWERDRHAILSVIYPITVKQRCVCPHTHSEELHNTAVECTFQTGVVKV